ncbi:MAG TPA: hypothetical protein VGK47_11335 [Nitrososphaeraceae archaeon]|jgi:hypothetical protein
MLDENGKFVITNKEWKHAVNSLPLEERMDKIEAMSLSFATQEYFKFREALVKALEEKEDE